MRLIGLAVIFTLGLFLVPSSVAAQPAAEIPSDRLAQPGIGAGVRPVKPVTTTVARRSVRWAMRSRASSGLPALR